MVFEKNFEEITHDMWQRLKSAGKPIVLYGMGDGADKICAELEARGMEISGVFASDGFVREKIFHGHKVENYSAVKQKLSDMIVLVCFGTKIREVIDNILKISDECELYAPDVPVFGEGIFDLDYFNKNFSRLENVYSRLADDISKKAFVNAIKYRLTGKIHYLFDCETDVDESYNSIICPKSKCTYIDIGAYNGDTIREFTSYSGKDISVHAFEPDARNFRKLEVYTTDCGISQISIHNMAAWDKKEELTFYSRSGRNSANTTSHNGAKASIITACDIDSVVPYADFIKIDAEGADIKALLGARKLVSTHAPTLCVAAYHRTEDYFLIPETVLEMYGDYDIYFRHFPHIPCWDTNFYFKRR